MGTRRHSAHRQVGRVLLTTGKCFRDTFGGAGVITDKDKDKERSKCKKRERSGCYYGSPASSSDGGCHPTLATTRGSIWQHWLAYGTWFQSSLEEQHGGDGQEAQGADGRLEEGARGADEAVGQGGTLQQRGERGGGR